jgi:hypothetical protein
VYDVSHHVESNESFTLALAIVSVIHTSCSTMMPFAAAKGALLSTSKRPVLRAFASSTEKVWNVYLSG